jgi:predicted nuclease of predicted toxin-antitoxin system
VFELVADENVPTPVVEALRSNGYEVHRAQEEYGQGTADGEILEACADEGRVILTNDNDFALLVEDAEHAGVVVYNDQNLRTREILRGVVSIDNAYDSPENQLEWLEGWI